MKNRISQYEEPRGNGPQPIGEVLTELLARYEARFPDTRIAVIETPGVMEDQTCLFYPGASASAS
jgi:hypothetical protein